MAKTSKKRSSGQVISHTDFVRDLSRGIAGEEIVEDFFLDKFGLIADNVSKRNPDYDLIVADLDPMLMEGKKISKSRVMRGMLKKIFNIPKKDEITVEVKYDQAAARYGNLFIEIFFNVDTGSPGTTFKCKADVVTWVVPAKAKRKYHIYMFDRAKFNAWMFHYIFTTKGVKYKTPGISPKARGVAVPITDAVDSPAFLGDYIFSI